MTFPVRAASFQSAMPDENNDKDDVMKPIPMGIPRFHLTEGSLQGKATYKRANGDTFTVEFKGVDSFGNGSFTFSDGSTYVGGFKNGEFFGKGTYTTKLMTWKADFKGGLPGTVEKCGKIFKFIGEKGPSGSGEVIISKDFKFEGNFLAGTKLSGKGKYVCANGKTFSPSLYNNESL